MPVRFGKKPDASGARNDLTHLLLAALMIALTAAVSQVMIPLPLVPINLGLLAVLLTGFVLPTRWALVSIGGYLLMGALGLPVFAGLRGGPQAFFGNTGGYLLGYFFSVAVIALLKGRAATLIMRFWLCSLALLACYIPGVLWLMFLTGRPLGQALPLAVYPFVPADLIKCLLVCLAVPRVQKALARAGLYPGA